MAITFTGNKVEAPKEFFVPGGDYRLRVIEAKEDTSTNGNDMMKMKLRVLMEDGEEGPAFNEQLTFTPKAFWKVDQFLKSAGKHPGEGEQINLEADDMIGWELNATLKIREYVDGKGITRKTNEVVAYLFENEF